MTNAHLAGWLAGWLAGGILRQRGRKCETPRIVPSKITAAIARRLDIFRAVLVLIAFANSRLPLTHMFPRSLSRPRIVVSKPAALFIHFDRERSRLRHGARAIAWQTGDDHFVVVDRCSCSALKRKLSHVPRKSEGFRRISGYKRQVKSLIFLNLPSKFKSSLKLNL